MDDADPPAARKGRIRGWPGWARLKRTFPPARLLWIVLLTIALVNVRQLRGLGLASIAVFPLIAVATDLVFQRIRFVTVRVPDAAVATGLFVALLLPPTVSLAFGAVAALVGVGLRHALRYKGRPWFNPATVGVVLALWSFGLGPAWWVAAGTAGIVLLVVLGVALLLVVPRVWRIPIAFFAAYGVGVVLTHWIYGESLLPSVLLLSLADPATVFFGLYMATEPRTAPGPSLDQVLYGVGLGIAATIVPLYLPSSGLLLALLLANLGVLGARFARAEDATPAPAADRAGGRPSARPAPRKASSVRWPVGYRAGAALLVLVVLYGAASLQAASTSPPPPITSTSAPGRPAHHVGGTTLSGCTQDSASISPSVATSLHNALGPSVLLSYDPNSGVVVFYDTVNHVTVTETDMYEDYGYAEFNGDDYTVSGCHP